MHHVWFLTYQIKKNCFYVMTCSLFQIVKNLIIGVKRKEVLMTEINAKIMRFFFLIYLNYSLQLRYCIIQKVT